MVKFWSKSAISWQVIISYKDFIFRIASHVQTQFLDLVLLLEIISAPGLLTLRLLGTQKYLPKNM